MESKLKYQEGNIVNHYYDGDEYEQVTIVGQVYDRIHIQLPTGGGTEVDIKTINPIPLTAEWLERLGLKQKPPEPDDYQQWGNLHMTIAKYDDGFYLYVTATDPWHDQAVGKKIEYVHTLQNISLDLFGEELNIEL